MSYAQLDPKVIASIPPAMLKTIPAETPPPGVRPNFADPSTQVPAILGVSSVFFALAIICFSVRIYTKLAISKSWKWDDLTCLLGFMFGIPYYVVVVIGCLHGTAGRHLWELHLDRALNKSSLVQNYVTTIMATPALGFTKCSLFIQYYLLFRPLRWVRITVWIGVTLCAAFYIPISIAAFILNSPWPGETFFEGVLSWHYLKFAKFSIPTGVIGSLADWYLLILPIPAVLKLKMSTPKKIGLLIVFMTGGLATIASTVCLVFRIKLQRDPYDPTWKVGYLLLWQQVEMFAGVAASSMPTVHQFFHRRNISLLSLGVSLKTILTNLLPISSRGDLSDKSHHYSYRGEGKLKISTDYKAFRMRDLESGDGERKTARKGRSTESERHITRDTSIAQEEMDEALFSPAVVQQRVG